MRIPREGFARTNKVRELIDQCQQSMGARHLLYDKRRRWFLWGNDSELPVRYNRLMSHTELVASFLYSAEHVQFSLTTPDNNPISSEMLDAMSPHLMSTFRDSGLVYKFADALLWALVYDSMFLKLGWNSRRQEIFGKIIDPYTIGVFDEAEGDLSDQQAFCHEFSLPFEEAKQRLIRAGRKADVPRLGVSTERPKERYPPVLRNLIIGATPGANLQGNVIGEARAELQSQATYAPETSHDLVRFTELYAWIDTDENENNHDYASFTMAEPDILVSDSRETIAAMASLQGKTAKYKSATNIFMPGEHPFVNIKPYRIYDYFWGECHTERLIRLQDWSNERLEQIADLLKQNVDPFRAAFGITGLSDEKIEAAGGPGSWIMQSDPTGKIEEFRPPIPKELFIEFNEIGTLFEEASGLTKTITGQGAEGVRSKEHARQLATTGSGRIKRVAVGLEESLSTMARLAMKLMINNDNDPLKTSTGREFVMAQIEGDINIRVAGHSHSPLFADDTKQMADELFKASAIDKEAYLVMKNPPGVESLINRLHKREKMEQEAAARGVSLPGTKEAQERARSHHKAA